MELHCYIKSFSLRRSVIYRISNQTEFGNFKRWQHIVPAQLFKRDTGQSRLSRGAWELYTFAMTNTKVDSQYSSGGFWNMEQPGANGPAQHAGPPERGSEGGE